MSLFNGHFKSLGPILNCYITRNKKEILENVARNRNENIHPVTRQNIKNKCMRHLIPSTKLTSSSHNTFHFSYMKFLDEMFIKLKVSSIFKEKNNSV